MNYLSLFSGIGGFEYGIEQSRYADKLNCIGFGEIDKYAKNICKKHYPNHVDLGDVTKIRTEDLPSFDFLVGGFPCQAFSVAGLRRGFSDTRGTLFFEIARILKDKKPKYFLLENVKGLLSHDKGRTFQTILRTLSELGYDVQWEIFNSKNHGVPQNRERIYIKGFLRTRCGQEILSLRKAGATVDARQRETEKHIKLHSSLGWQGSEIYDSNGISPTLICGHAGSTKIVDEEAQLVRLNEKPENGRDHEENRLYSEEGISPTLTATKASQIKVGCVDDGELLFPSTKEGNFFAVTTHHRGMPFSKKIDNYVFEKTNPKIIKDKNYEGYNQNTHVYKTSGLMPTLTTDTRNYISEEISFDVDNVDNSIQKNGGKVKIVGNVYPSGGQNGIVYDSNGLVGTLGLSSGGKGGEGKKVLVHKEDEPANKIIPVNNGAQNNMIYDENGLNPTITVEPHPTKILLRNNTKKGYAEASDGDGFVINQYNCRGRVQKESVPTLNTGDGCGAGTFDGYVVRRLTPVETERLQGFPRNWTKYGADGSLISDTQRYKCCGNAVTTNVVRDILDTWDMIFD